MNKAQLSIYLSDKCNLNCSYCNIDYSIKPTVTEKDIKKFILNNIDNIDTNNIELLGGEPSII